MKAVLLSTYELGRQPFGLASPAAWLAEAGAQVSVNDLAVEALDEAAVRAAGLIAVYVPMHTATRLAGLLAQRLRALNAAAHLCFYGLYAPMNAGFLRALGAETIVGGEFEAPLVALYERLTGSPTSGESGESGDGQADVVLAKQRFRVPERGGLPPLENYAHLEIGGATRVVGYTEASRGCKHLCRHCPVVPVYQGQFRVVERTVVMEDIRRQVAAGARHITFGDPDFFNGPGHAIALARAFHAAFPDLTYDVTIKIEHLLSAERHLPTLADTGCLFVTTAVESIDDRVLALLDKGHTRADFVRAVTLARAAGLTLSPTFIPFAPWTTAAGYLELLEALVELDLIAEVAPVQLAIRLLVPRGSLLLAVPEMQRHLGPFDDAALCYPWTHPDPAIDRLQARVMGIVEEGTGRARSEVFAELWRAAHEACGRPAPALPGTARDTPQMSEPWYCCAEPSAEQLARL